MYEYQVACRFMVAGLECRLEHSRHSKLELAASIPLSGSRPVYRAAVPRLARVP